MSPATDVVLAHGGGLPEAAMIGLPILLFAVFFFLERRARRHGGDAGRPSEGDDKDA